MNKNWTPGPWRVSENEPTAHTGRKTYDVISDAEEIVGCEGLWNTEEKDRANANLIAAAPELYDALEVCFQIASLFNHDGDRVWDACKQQVLSAMRKARGECEHEENAEGTWVDFDDHAKAIAVKDAEIALLRTSWRMRT